MKKLFIYFIALLPLFSLAQVDRSKAPQPSAAPEIKIGRPATYTLSNGLKVFVVQNTKLPQVTANLTIDIDGIVEGDKAGLTSMGGSLLRRGTASMNKAKLDEEIDFLGASINTLGTSVSASSLKNNFSKVIALMGDIVLRPSFPAGELEKIRKQELSGLQAAKDDPQEISENVANRLVYGKNHPYGDILTEKTINNVKLEDIKKYFSTYWKPNIAYLVFVGDITPAEAKALAEKNFGTWKKGIVSKVNYKIPQPPAKTYIGIVDRPASVQSLIKFVTPVQLKPGSPEAIPSSVMNNILGGGFSGRLFANLREKHGFTYGASSGLKSDRLIGAFTANASVRNEKTDSAIAEFINEFKRIRVESLKEDEVARMKNYLSGGFARSLENPSTIANFALNVARYNLPQNYYQDYLKNLGNVSPQTVQSMANKFILPDQMHIIIVGNAKQISPGLEKYGEVKYFDIYGNETSAPTVKKTDASVTAQSILEKALASTGTSQAISSVKDIEFNGEATIMGKTISVNQKNVLPSAYSFTVSMGGMVLQKKMLKDGKYSITQQGQVQEPAADEKEEIDEEAAFFSDAYLLKQTGNTYTVGGIEKVDGKDAYALQVKTAAGREFTNYYDVATGFKVKSSTVKDGGPLGKITVQSYFSNYKVYNGLQLPTHIVVDLGQFKQDIVFKEVKVNSGLKPEDIK
ncbi:MAG: pitrilysin family protein [Segetibacter sp.]